MTTQEVLERIKDDPRTTWLAIVLGALWAAGEYLHGAHFEPWGSMLVGIAGFGAFGCMLFTRFSPPPPADLDKTPAGGTKLIPQEPPK